MDLTEKEIRYGGLAVAGAVYLVVLLYTDASFFIRISILVLLGIVLPELVLQVYEPADRE